jgi:hypothetical protein
LVVLFVLVLAVMSMELDDEMELDEEEEDEGPIRPRNRLRVGADLDEDRGGKKQRLEGVEGEEEEEEEEEEGGQQQQQDEEVVVVPGRSSPPDELFFWGDPEDSIKIKKKDLHGGPGKCKLAKAGKPNPTQCKTLKAKGRYARPRLGNSVVSGASLYLATHVTAVTNRVTCCDCV